MKKALAIFLALLGLVALAGVAGAKSKTKAAVAGAQVREVPVAVTSDGFQPAEIHVKRGEKVRLVVTRKVQRTCATEIVMKDLAIHKELPLGTPVIVDITPTSAGEIRFACAMNMVGGKLVVE